MASPQKENGFTSIANELMEALARTRIPGEARQVLDVIFRRTYGFGKKSCDFQRGYLSKATGISRQNVSRSLRKLESMGIINVVNTDYDVVNTDYDKQYSINKNYELWNQDSKKRTYSKKTTSVVNIDSTPYKETLKKKNSIPSKKSKGIIPDIFPITEEMKNWFIEQNFSHIEIKSATDEFVDYWRGSGKTMKDWVATWRNGMRKREEWSAERALKNGTKKTVNSENIFAKDWF